MKDILKEPNKKLFKKSEYVSIPLSNRDKNTLKEMHEFLINSQDPEISKKYHLRSGAAIAAPQLGILRKMVALHIDDFDGTMYSFGIINPIITYKSEDIIYMPDGEGCLSVETATTGITPRSKTIKWEGFIYDFEKNELLEVIDMELSGYIAIVFQHEYDHLDGILFTSKEFKKLDKATNVLDLEQYSFLKEKK
jgi:peptide deformylase